MSFTEDEARSSDQLREIIKYLRRERDVTVGKFEVAQAENQRLEAQRTCLRTQLEQLTKELANEREKNQVKETKRKSRWLCRCYNFSFPCRTSLPHN